MRALPRGGPAPPGARRMAPDGPWAARKVPVRRDACAWHRLAGRACRCIACLQDVAPFVAGLAPAQGCLWDLRCDRSMALRWLAGMVSGTVSVRPTRVTALWRRGHTRVAVTRGAGLVRTGDRHFGVGSVGPACPGPFRCPFHRMPPGGLSVERRTPYRGIPDRGPLPRFLCFSARTRRGFHGAALTFGGWHVVL